MIKVIDNFVDPYIVGEFQLGMLSSSFPWSFCENVVSAVLDDNYQFTHMFYNEGEPRSQYYQQLVNGELLTKLQAASLIKIKANLQPRTYSASETPLHVDHQFPNALTAIYYVNTNDGYTYFESGEKVDSVAGRLVVFPSELKHGGATCTDQKYRCVINFNFYPDSLEHFALTGDS